MPLSSKPPSGGGGEPYLATEEKLQVLRSVKQLAPKRVALCAACIPASTGQVVDQIRALTAEGPDFVEAGGI